MPIKIPDNLPAAQILKKKISLLWMKREQQHKESDL